MAEASPAAPSVKRWAVCDGLQVRQSDDGGAGTLYGPALVYGDVANVYGIRESIAPGAFGDTLKSDRLICNFMHDRRQPLARTDGGGLVLTDGPKQVYAEISLPNTVLGRDTAELVDRKVLRGLSIEFYPQAYRRGDGMVIWTKARFAGLGVVDIPAYGKSIPDKRWLELAEREDDDSPPPTLIRRIPWL